MEHSRCCAGLVLPLGGFCLLQDIPSGTWFLLEVVFENAGQDGQTSVSRWPNHLPKPPQGRAKQHLIYPWTACQYLLFGVVGILNSQCKGLRIWTVFEFSLVLGSMFGCRCWTGSMKMIVAWRHSDEPWAREINVHQQSMRDRRASRC